MAVDVPGIWCATPSLGNIVFFSRPLGLDSFLLMICFTGIASNLLHLFFCYLNHTMLTLRVVSPAACVVWCCWSFFTARFSASLRWLSASFCCNEWIACGAGVEMGWEGWKGKGVARKSEEYI